MEIRNLEEQNKNILNQNEQIFSRQMNSLPYLFPMEISNLNSETNLQNSILKPIQYQENKEQIQDNEQSNNKSEESEEKKNQKNLKRRSKSEVEGRTHECKLCNKSYLSYPALYTHYKLKHNTNNSSGRGRGRPKKEQNENEVEKIKYNPINITFFYKEERNKRLNSPKRNSLKQSSSKRNLPPRLDFHPLRSFRLSALQLRCVCLYRA